MRSANDRVWPVVWTTAEPVLRCVVRRQPDDQPLTFEEAIAMFDSVLVELPLDKPESVRMLDQDFRDQLKDVRFD